MLRVVLSMVLSLACLICSPTWADIPKPASIEDTVAAMADAYRASDKISDVQVNNEDSSVRVTFNDGTELTSYATNLHVKLINAESDQQRQELFDFHIAGIFEVNLSEEQAWTNESLARVFPVLRHRDFKTFSDKTGGSPLVTSGIIGDSDILLCARCREQCRVYHRG